MHLAFLFRHVSSVGLCRVEHMTHMLVLGSIGRWGNHMVKCYQTRYFDMYSSRLSHQLTI